MRVGQRRRSVRAIESPSLGKGIWLVLFFDQRRLDVFDIVDSLVADASRSARSFRRAGRADVRRHSELLAGSAQVRPHSARTGWEALREAISREGVCAAAQAGWALYLFVAIFWALYEQTSSAWITLQAEQHESEPCSGSTRPNRPQTHTLNPILILLFMPLFTYVIYPTIELIFPLTALRKISIGFFVTALSFVVSAVIESWISAGERPHFAWQALAYAIMTAAEVMVSITCLEFSYTQAPPKMKSLMMAVNLLSVSLGNLFTALVNGVNSLFKAPSGESMLGHGANYYLFFCGVMLVTAVAFIFFRRESSRSEDVHPAGQPVDDAAAS